ncbi:ArsR/SmtB family transcription factor [Nocardioides dongkuii]|uniref:ArsR/SmtB family transcription factor n=1 Tax=Nocardioides dongkuii TaxID=2760089 RepID=UPI0015FD3F5E|nr:DUF5937 family protein [Nocardioides dongkuii]
MIEYELEGLDLGAVRFAISPLNELGLGLRVFRDPGRYPQHLPWLRMTESARAGLDTEVLTALTNERLWTPDFLHPLPTSPLTRFDDELALVAALPGRVVRGKLLEVHDPLPPVLAGRSDRVLARVVRAVREFWETCFAPWWPRMRTVLEGDVAHRGRVIAQRGLAAMFDDLSVRVRLVGNVVQVSTTGRGGYRRTTTGAGLTLVPSIFSRGGSTPITAEQPPQVMYAARGVGTLWLPDDRVAGPQALVDVLGAARAQLLVVLESPASSTELGVRLGVTTSAVNQHLRALRAAGLLTSARHGRAVLYLRSDLGDRLVRGG